MAPSINKQGVLSGYPVEPFQVLPDGSTWRLLLFHVIDYGTHLFTPDLAPYSNEWGLFSRLKYADEFKYDDKYEFYVIQDGREFRWTQTSKPTDATIAGFAAVTGYTKPDYGLAKGNQTSSYFGYNSWWGAAGSYTKFTSNGATGIPGFTGVAKNYLALYVRVPDIHAFMEEDAVNANNFYEY